MYKPNNQGALQACLSEAAQCTARARHAHCALPPYRPPSQQHPHGTPTPPSHHWITPAAKHSSWRPPPAASATAATAGACDTRGQGAARPCSNTAQQCSAYCCKDGGAGSACQAAGVCTRGALPDHCKPATGELPWLLEVIPIHMQCCDKFLGGSWEGEHRLVQKSKLESVVLGVMPGAYVVISRPQRLLEFPVLRCAGLCCAALCSAALCCVFLCFALLCLSAEYTVHLGSQRLTCEQTVKWTFAGQASGRH